MPEPGQPPGGLDAVHDRHPYVHQHHVGGDAAQPRDRFRAVTGLAHHGQVVLRLDHHPQPGADEPLVVDEEQTERHPAADPVARGAGRTAYTSKPPPARGPAVRVPSCS